MRTQLSLDESLVDSEFEERASILDFKRDLSDMDETYSDTKTDIEVLESNAISATQKVIKVKEVTYMTIADTFYAF